jgi:hypothetical protein
MSDRDDAFREARAIGKAKHHEQRLENATYTAAEVKVLTETASKVAYELGRKEAGEHIAERIEFGMHAKCASGDYAVCEVCHALKNMALGAREYASQPSGATSDATSGVGGHQEVSEAARSPQKPCGHPDCLCHRPRGNAG